MMTAQERAEMEFNIDNKWSLADYLADMNARARAEMAATPGLWVSEMTEDLAHWAEIQVFTARDLANYLDACFQRELEKARYDMWEEDCEASRKEQARRDQRERAELKAQYVNVQPEPNNAMSDALLSCLRGI